MISAIDVIRFPKESKEFFKQLLSQQGLPVGNLTIEPFCNAGDCSHALAAAGGESRIFDIGSSINAQISSVVEGLESGRSYYYGKLFTTSHIYVNSATSVEYTVSLCNGRNNGPLNSWLFKQRSPSAGVDNDVEVFSGTVFGGTTLKLGFQDQFENVLFNYIRLGIIQAGVGAAGVNIQFIFTGIRINLQ